MRRRRGNQAALACLVICLALLSAASTAAQDTAAASIQRLAKEKGCAGKPNDYVSGYFSPDDTLSGVFWCVPSTTNDKRRFLIVVVDRHAKRELRCPSVMVSINQPLGLRILRAEGYVDAELSSFTVRDKPSATGPKGKYAVGPIVDTGDDRVGEQWFCHLGVWLVRVNH
jgi:hypothetical protein